MTVLEFDYFGLHQRCWKLLRGIEEVTKQAFEAHLGDGSLEALSDEVLACLPGFCLSLFALDCEGAKILKHNAPAPSEVLVHAATVLDRHLATGDGAIEMAQALRQRGRSMIFELSSMLTNVGKGKGNEDLDLTNAMQIFSGLARSARFFDNKLAKSFRKQMVRSEGEVEEMIDSGQCEIMWW